MNQLKRWCDRCKVEDISQRGPYARYCFQCSLDAEQEARGRAKEKMELKREGLI